MKLPVAIERAATRFNGMSVRERVLVPAAALVALVMLWMLALMDPISTRERVLTGEMASLQEAITTAAQTLAPAAAADVNALAKEKSLRLTLAVINAKLSSQSAGLIAPEKMVQVIHEVLRRQHGITLVSLHNKPVTTLVKATSPEASPTTAVAVATGPYVHPVELVIEGSYLDVLAYLQELENLQWRFYWTALELETLEYPLNRVRIELSTLSMDPNWIGV